MHWTHKDRVVLRKDQCLSNISSGGAITYICRLLYKQNRNALASYQHISDIGIIDSLEKNIVRLSGVSSVSGCRYISAITEALWFNYHHWACIGKKGPTSLKFCTGARRNFLNHFKIRLWLADLDTVQRVEQKYNRGWVLRISRSEDNGKGGVWTGAGSLYAEHPWMQEIEWPISLCGVVSQRGPLAVERRPFAVAYSKSEVAVLIFLRRLHSSCVHLALILHASPGQASSKTRQAGELRRFYHAQSHVLLTGTTEEAQSDT